MPPLYRHMKKIMAVDYSFSSAAVRLFISSCILSLTLMISCVDTLSAQKPELPLDADLKKSSQKMKIKIGPKYLNSTFGIKIGDYKMARGKIKRGYYHCKSPRFRTFWQHYAISRSRCGILFT